MIARLGVGVLLFLLINPVVAAQETGTITWVHSLETAHTLVHMDAEGAMYGANSAETGSFPGTLVAKYDADGQRLWEAEASGQWLVTHLAANTSGAVFVMGFCIGNTDFDGDGAPEVDLDYDRNERSQFFLAKYQPDGVLQWVRVAPGPEIGAKGYQLAVNEAGAAFVAGEGLVGTDFTGNGKGDLDGQKRTVRHFLTAYNPAGEVDWVWSYEPDESGIAGLYADDRFLYLTGFTTAPELDLDGDGRTDWISDRADGRPAFFVARYQPRNRSLWVVPLPGVGYALTVDDDDHLFVTGTYLYDVDFDGDGRREVPHEGLGDFFLAKYTGSGRAVWMRSATGTGYEGGFSVAADGMGGAYVAGSFSNEMDLDRDGSIDVRGAGQGRPGLFVGHYDADGILSWKRPSLIGAVPESQVDVVSFVVEGKALPVLTAHPKGVYLAGIYEGTAVFPAGTGQRTPDAFASGAGIYVVGSFANSPAYTEDLPAFLKTTFGQTSTVSHTRGSFLINYAPRP